MKKKAEKTDFIKLTDEQKLMLQMSEEDIKFGRVLSQEELDKQDREWLKNLNFNKVKSGNK